MLLDTCAIPRAPLPILCSTKCCSSIALYSNIEANCVIQTNTTTATTLFLCMHRWAGQSAALHDKHMKQVAYRGILQAVLEERSRQESEMQRGEEGEKDARDGGLVVPGRLRGVKCDNIENYAEGVASNLQGMIMYFHSANCWFWHFVSL